MPKTKKKTTRALSKSQRSAYFTSRRNNRNRRAGVPTSRSGTVGAVALSSPESAENHVEDEPSRYLLVDIEAGYEVIQDDTGQRWRYNGPSTDEAAGLTVDYGTTAPSYSGTYTVSAGIYTNIGAKHLQLEAFDDKGAPKWGFKIAGVVLFYDLSVDDVGFPWECDWGLDVTITRKDIAGPANWEDITP